MEAAVWGFIGTIVGALASLGTTLLSTRQASSLQASASSFDRAQKHRAFQRDTLLALQDALHDLMRLVARGHLEDREAFCETGVWGKEPLTPEVNEGQRLARRQFLILVERVANDALRADLKRVNESLGHVSFRCTEIDADAIFNAASEQATPALEQIGNVLRAQY